MTSISQSMEDYLKAIFEILEREDRASTSTLADRMRIAPSSVTAMLKRLDDLGLVRYEPYRGATLTEAGTKRALEMVRHHRLIELYLSEALGVPWDQVHAEAEKLEHVISEDLEQRMADALDDPRVDPHGAPIPTLDGTLTRVETRCLLDAPPGCRFRVVEVDDRDPELLRYLAHRRLTPGTRSELVRIEPFDGPVVVRSGDGEVPIGRTAAAAVRVSIADESEAHAAGDES
jgi:DtxR family Mn-dependent transcriptional regulator